MNEYQRRAAYTAIYPNDLGLPYTALGLAGEAGEFANKVKKIIRDGETPIDWLALADELGDVLWYVAMAGEEMGYSLEEIGLRNLDKLQRRQEQGKLGGSGDQRQDAETPQTAFREEEPGKA